MLKLKGYLKPFAGGLLLAIGLLFLQAICDLNLPNYMSDIVNVGIQQGGIEHAAPDAISEEGMAFITMFLGDKDKALVGGAYDLVFSAEEYEPEKTYASRYPLAGDLLYVRVDGGLMHIVECTPLGGERWAERPVMDAATRAALDRAFGLSAWTFINALQELPFNLEASMADMQDLDLKQLYPHLPLLTIALGPEGLEAARQGAEAQAESILAQTGTLFAKAFYAELGMDTGSMQTAYLLRIGGLMLLVALLGGAATVLVGLISSQAAAGLARNLRHAVFAKIEGFSQTEFDRFSTASLITRCTNDITQVQMFMNMGVRMLCYAPIMGIGGVIMAVNKAVSMSWIIALAVLVMLGIILVILALALPRFKLIQKLTDRLNLVSRENLNGMMVIRVFGAQAHEARRFDAANLELNRVNLFIQRVMAFIGPMMMLIMNGVMLAVIWVGAHQISQSALQVGDMMAFMQYAMQILMSFMMIAMMFVFVPRAAVSAERIAEVLYTEQSIRDPDVPRGFDPARRGVVEFRNVSFRYAGAEEDALHGLSFTALPGQTTAIIGPTGSGKSTVAHLALRFFDTTQGQVLVSGADVREVTQKDLRDAIGFVPQRGVLLSGSVATNLAYGKPDAGPEELRAAASIAQALDFIEEKPEGFDYEIAQGGANVSGGQKQRLSIARALAKGPPILIFDDSFSALDFKTDAALRKALREHAGDSTVLVFAQRVGTILHADQIVVLDAGRIVGIGAHKELLKTCPLYVEIASSQLSKEELGEEPA